jgi:DnaJ-class molecular chaperone
VPHPIFERKDNDLKIKIELTLREALVGFRKAIAHLDGRSVWVDRSDMVTKPGLLVRLKGEGMPVFNAYGDYGDMLVTCNVILPQTLTSEQERLF